MNPMNKTHMLSIAAVLGLFAPPAANAAIYYVATNGFDGNPGTQSQPFASVQRAINECGEFGDTVILADGVYNTGNLVLWESVHGINVAKNILLRSQSDDPANCVIDLSFAQLRAAIGLAFGSATSEECTFRGITFRNAPQTCISVNGYPRLILTNCTFSGHERAVDGSNGTITIDHCRFVNNLAYRSFAAAINNNGTATIDLSNCVFDGSISVASPAAVYGARSIVNSTFIRNRANDAYGSTIEAVPMITNCTFLGNGNDTILCVGTDHTVVTNCVFRDEGTHFHGVGIPGGTFDVRYSNVRGGYTGEGNIDAVPAFVRLPGTLSDADPGNLRQLPGSPGVNAGTATALEIAASDPDGLPRVLGGAPDMGAFESWDTTSGMWFVDKATGNDSFVGSPAQPFATVTRAIAAASPGQSVLIGSGAYGADRPRITKSLRLTLWGSGAARIGQP